MRTLRAFSGTLSTFAVATCLAWVYRNFLIQLWVAPLLEAWSKGGHRSVPLSQLYPTDIFTPLLEISLLTGGLVALPVFYIEGWLYICRVARRENARRLALPFAFVSVCTMALSLCLAQQVSVPVLLAWVGVQNS